MSTVTIECDFPLIPDDEKPIACRKPEIGERVFGTNGCFIWDDDRDRSANPRHVWIILAPKGQPMEPAEDVFPMKNLPKPLEGFERVEEFRRATGDEQYWNSICHKWFNGPTDNPQLCARRLPLTGQAWVDSLELGDVFDCDGIVCCVAVSMGDTNQLQMMGVDCGVELSEVFINGLSDATCTRLKPETKEG